MKNQLFVVPLLLLSPLAHAGFNFGDCSGSGTFEQQIIHYGGDYENTITIGEIPAGIQGLKVSLTSDKDVDIRLYGENEDKIVHWPYGILSKSKQATKPYKDVNVTYSGYNGVDGEKGHEFIEINTTTPTIMTMKAFGYQAGYATVNYSWEGKEGCDTENNTTQGTGSFTQEILEQDTILVGTIPPNIENVEINLTSEKDLDIQLYGVDGTAIVSWQPKGLLSGAMQQSITYKGMNITWSGYTGTQGQAGHEFIKISGLTSEMLVMKVFGYEAGEADVSYSWGNPTTQDDDNAIILAYAEDNSNQVPTVQNYRNIGLSDKTVNTQTLQEINTIIAGSDVADIDTFTELLHILSQTSACLSREELEVRISNEENLSEVNTECITDMNALFYGKGWSYNPDIIKWDVSNVTDMSYMFQGAYAFNQSIGNWDVSHVTTMEGMFTEIPGDDTSTRFNQDISQWNVSHVTNMRKMFRGSVFNQSIKNWNVSHVITMEEMFNWSAFNQSIEDWNVSSVTNMNAMFNYAYKFNQPLANWNTSNVTTMALMFRTAKEFNQPINNWDTSHVTSMDAMFEYTLKFNQDIGDWNTSNVTNMIRMFAHTKAFNQDISTWNISNVKYISESPDSTWSIPTGMFAYTESFNQDISDWNISKISSLKNMFKGAKKFNQDLSIWDTSNITDMSGMFENAVKFDQDISHWDISHVSSMNNMFKDVTLSVENYDKLLTAWRNQTLLHNISFHAGNSRYSASVASYRQMMIDIFGWDITDGGEDTPQKHAFAKISAYGEDQSNPTPTLEDYKDAGIHTISKEDIEEANKAVEDYNWEINTFDNLLYILSETSICLSRSELITMIENDENITQVNTECIKYMFSLFQDNKVFNQDISRWDVSNVENISSMFKGATAFNQPIGDWNISKVTNMYEIFEDATSFNQAIGKWDVSNVTNMEGIFNNAKSFNKPIGDWNVSNVTNMMRMFDGAKVFNQSLEKWDVSNVTAMAYMFSRATSFNQPIGDWNVSHISASEYTGMSAMFYYATSFNQPIEKWDVSHITSMRIMFSGATSFSQPIEKWDVSNVTSMSSMFSGATSFNQPIEKWDVSNVTSMSSMFSRATSFNQPIEKWDVSNVENMSTMFYRATSFNQPIANWQVSNVTNMSYMFYLAETFNQATKKWNVSNVTNMVRMFASTNYKDHNLSSWDVISVTDHTDFFKDAGSGNTEPNWND